MPNKSQTTVNAEPSDHGDAKRPVSGPPNWLAYDRVGSGAGTQTEKRPPLQTTPGES